MKEKLSGGQMFLLEFVVAIIILLIIGIIKMVRAS